MKSEADQDNAAMTCPLTVQQRNDCQQVADVQAVGRRIKPAVDCLRRTDQRTP